MAKAAIMHFAEAGGGLTVGLTGQIVGAAMTVGAIANYSQQRKQQQKKKEKDERPPKDRPLIIERPKQQPTMTCEGHEWAVFNKEVKEVEAAAAKHFEERKGPRSLNRVSRVMDSIDSILSFITGEGGEFDPGDSGDSLADLMNKQTRNTEIEEATKGAAAKRDERIQKNCKKP